MDSPRDPRVPIDRRTRRVQRDDVGAARSHDRPQRRLTRLQQRRVAYADLDGEGRLALDVERVRQWRLQASIDQAAGDEVFHHDIEPDMWAYGHRVLPGMILDGDIARVLHRLSGYLPRDVGQAAGVIAKDFDLAVELAMDTMMMTMPGVKESILTDWDGYRDDPACLGTWFVGLSSMKFPAVYRRWRRGEKANTGIHYSDQIPLTGSMVEASPEAKVVFELEIDRHLELIDDPLEQTIARLDALDLTDREIAELLDITVNVVDYRLRKTRRRARSRRDQEFARDFFTDPATATA